MPNPGMIAACRQTARRELLACQVTDHLVVGFPVVHHRLHWEVVVGPLLPLHQRRKRRMHFSGSHLAGFKITNFLRWWINTSNNK